MKSLRHARGGHCQWPAATVPPAEDAAASPGSGDPPGPPGPGRGRCHSVSSTFKVTRSHGPRVAQKECTGGLVAGAGHIDRASLRVRARRPAPGAGRGAPGTDTIDDRRRVLILPVFGEAAQLVVGIPDFMMCAARPVLRSLARRLGACMPTVPLPFHKKINKHEPDRFSAMQLGNDYRASRNRRGARSSASCWVCCSALMPPLLPPKWMALDADKTGSPHA
jgi:hypothetical protein